MLNIERVFYGENMQIFTNISTTPKGGEINHAVNASFDDSGNLNFTEHDMGEGVAEFWGRDEYEYFFTIPKHEVAKFTIGSLLTSFNLPQKLTVGDLKTMCDEMKIKYSINSWF